MHSIWSDSHVDRSQCSLYLFRWNRLQAHSYSDKLQSTNMHTHIGIENCVEWRGEMKTHFDHSAYTNVSPVSSLNDIFCLFFHSEYRQFTRVFVRTFTRLLHIYRALLASQCRLLHRKLQKCFFNRLRIVKRKIKKKNNLLDKKPAKRFIFKVQNCWLNTQQIFFWLMYVYA